MNITDLAARRTDGNLIELARNLGSIFAFVHLDEFLDAGVDINTLLKEVFNEEFFSYFDCYMMPIDAALSFLQLGAEPKFVFSRVESDVLEKSQFDGVKLFTTLGAFECAGMKRSEILIWLEKCMFENRFGILETAFDYYPDEFKKYGVVLSNFTDRYLDIYGEYLTYDLDECPESISMDDLLNHYSIREIAEANGVCGFQDRFLPKFLARGGDINHLVKKFVDEIGYTDDYEMSDALFEIISRGGTDGVDFNKLAKSINIPDLCEEECVGWYNLLSAYGAEPAILRRFL